MGTLREVLAAHEWQWKAQTPTRIVMVCACGDQLIPSTSSAAATLDDHRAHVEQAVLAWLREVLGSAETVEAVAVNRWAALHPTGPWETWPEWDRQGFRHEARAALAVVAERLGTTSEGEA